MNIYSEEYFINYLMTANKALEELDKDKTKESMMKYVFNYGRAFICCYDIDRIEEMENLFECFETWKQAACMLTYRELFTIYPIEKDFDGYKYGMKDYWSSKEFIEESIDDLDEFVEEDVLMEIIMECDNNDLFRIAMRYVEIIEFFHAHKWGFTVLDEFLDSVGVEPIPRDSQGNLIGIVDGKVVKKPKEDTFVELDKKEKFRVIK